MLFGDVSFTVASHAAWVPGLDSEASWQRWINGDLPSADSGEPAVKAMPPMLRRRASPAAKLALEVAYAALPDSASDRHDNGELPVVFASRHGECARSVELLQELAAAAPLSPTSFSLSVHNAAAGLFSIARRARGNAIAIAAGASTVEHAVIEACALLADGARQVLLVVADHHLPAVFAPYADALQTPFGWAWLIAPADENSPHPAYSLQWRRSPPPEDGIAQDSGGVAVLRFFLDASAAGLVRHADGQRWEWMRHD